MKKIELLTLALACICCAKAPQGHPETKPEPETETDIIFRASVPDTQQTRIVLDGKTPKWEETDAIVVNGQQSTKTTLIDGGLRAEFTLPAVNAPYNAVAPASVVNVSDIVLPETQDYRAGSFDPASIVILANNPSSTDLSFEHAMAFVKITVKTGSDSHKIKRIELSAISGENLSGTFTPDYASASLSGGSEGKVVKLVCSGEGIAHNTPVYISVPAQNYADGIAMTIVDSQNHYMVTSSHKPFSAEKGKIYTTDVEFNPTGTYIDSNAPETEEGEIEVLSIEWDRDQTVSWAGGYGRIHHLADGRLMAVYESSGNACYKFSSNKGKTWTTGKVGINKINLGDGHWAHICNPEFAQLSATNPYHPGRIIYAGNIRPNNNRSDLCAYSICYATSDDNAVTWSERKVAYSSQMWTPATAKGCWEPFVLELPDGTIQIYFADETPYYALGQHYQNISVIESTDGGDSWGAARIVAYSSTRRDGMPVVMLYDNKLYLAIEHYQSGTHLFPQIVWNTVASNWSSTVTFPSSYRFNPNQTPLDAVNNYYGAPYLIATDNYFVLSYQSSEGSGIADMDHCAMDVIACPKSEMKNNIFTTMRGASRPILVDQTKDKALWNSLCHLEKDEILAICDCSGTIVVTHGTISGTE